MNPFYGNFTLGVLGGGQLGRMLIQEAADLNVSVAILDPDENAPCRNLADRFVRGSLEDFNTVYEFGKTVDLLTIEIEHVNVQALEKLVSEGKKVYPQPSVLKMIQDKGDQKLFYSSHKIPTAHFKLIDKKEMLKDYSKGFPSIQKLRKGGYDGRGVIKLVSEKDIEKAFDAPSVLEELIDFDKEISVIVARGVKGEIKTFPVVEMDFNPEANLVEFLFSPADISPEAEREAQRIARLVAEKTGIVGVLAVEMFITRAGEVLVNEIAPRPHNSGHQTIEGNFTSQYAQHLRAILGLPLGDPSILLPSVMVNLLGEKGFEGTAVYEGLEEVLAMNGVNIHLYGKKSTRPFRKMGHVTIVDKDLSSAKTKARIVKEKLKVKA